MRVYLAALENGKLLNQEIISYIRAHPNTISFLSSFASICQRCKDSYPSFIPYFKDFMLDSGAFTFMNSGGTEHWESYIERYADFITQNKIEKFFELDIDSIVGYDKVKEYRYRLERLTGRASIPVWHISRGWGEFVRMCEEYSYVAIGGIVTREILPRQYKYFPKFIKEAHKHKAQIHGLGFTNMEFLGRYHFDSVDSTAWTSGSRYANVYVFRDGRIREISVRQGMRLSDYKSLDMLNFLEWVKFQKYAEVHL